MFTVENDTILLDKTAKKIQAFRFEDTSRAPAIIVFVDEEKPELLKLQQGQAPPVKVKSPNLEADIQVITYSELSQYINIG